MKRFTVLVLASFFILALFSTSSLAVKVTGIGNISDQQFFSVTLDNDFTPSKGMLIYNDYGAKKGIKGEITSVTIDSSTKISFGGTYIAEDGAENTYSATVEDLGKGENLDNFSISDSTGYSAAGTAMYGGIDIQ